MTELRIEHVTVESDGATLVDQASLTVRSGELAVLLGPNGAGKTSLMRVAAGVEPASAGTVLLDGRDIAAMSPSDRARLAAYLPQTRPLAWPCLVRDVVALGRFAHGAALGRPAPEDRRAIEAAIGKCQLTDFAHRRTDTLSGGELARVHLARAFAAEAPLLLADEPVAALDPRHQFQIMELMRAYVAEGGGALIVLHDLSLAARFADRLIWMKDGRILADGPPAETLTPERLADIYGVKASIDGLSIEVDGAL